MLAVPMLAPLLTATPAQAASPVLISTIYYDSPGKDTGSNTSLNAEYVTLKNTGRTTVNLTGWTLHDAKNHLYPFKGKVSLRAGASVTIHTGKGKDTSAHRYWGRDWYVWNNTGDTASLHNAADKQVDFCAWKGEDAGYVSCA
jgi:hypothetical protein